MQFVLYFIEKVKKNKDIISITISLLLLVQAILFACLDTNMKVIFSTHYLCFVLTAIAFCTIFFFGILLYLYSDQVHDTYSEFSKIGSTSCPKRNGILMNQKDYQKKMQIFFLPEIEKIEESVNDNDQIWVLTTDVKLETTVSAIAEAMKRNLDRGVSYKYYIPNTIRNEANILELDRKYKQYGNFELIRIDSEYKLLFERFDVIIYSPDKNSSEGRRGFICVNFSDDESMVAFKKISEEDTMNLIGKLQRVRRITHAN